MQIRTMLIQDYDSANSLWLKNAGIGLNHLDDSREGIEKYLIRNTNTCFVAEKKGNIIGVIMAGHDGRRWYLYHMAVAVAEQRKGIGHALLNAALAALKAEAVNKVALVVFAHNEQGNLFWEKNGFTVRDDLIYRNQAINELIRMAT